MPSPSALTVCYLAPIVNKCGFIGWRRHRLDGWWRANKFQRALTILPTSTVHQQPCANHPRTNRTGVARNRWLLTRPRWEFSHSSNPRVRFILSTSAPDSRRLMSFPSISWSHSAPHRGVEIVKLGWRRATSNTVWSAVELKQIGRDLCGLISYYEVGGAQRACF